MNVVDDLGWTPLMRAGTFLWQINCVAALFHFDFLLVTMLNRGNGTDIEEMVNVLLDNGADKNIKNRDEKTALMLLAGKCVNLL